jgi:hypothetical protein
VGCGDAEEGSERDVPGAAPAEAEDELVEIGLKMFAAQAMVDDDPCLAFLAAYPILDRSI